ncbi:MAG: hypothetical protein Q4G46_06515 [Propionibacteriaceae bacterium]|nr:hypothetical protein [Propionibacteriaceae bacterium]
MSTNPGEPTPQEWPTYPGLPGDPGRLSEPRPYVEPEPAAETYQPYPQPPAGLPHQQMQPHQAPYQQQSQNSTWLQNKWTWIIVGVIGVFFITGMASGEFRIAPLIFAVVIWQILRHRRKT